MRDEGGAVNPCELVEAIKSEQCSVLANRTRQRMDTGLNNERMWICESPLNTTLCTGD